MKQLVCGEHGRAQRFNPARDENGRKEGLTPFGSN